MCNKLASFLEIAFTVCLILFQCSNCCDICFEYKGNGTGPKLILQRVETAFDPLFVAFFGR